MIQGDPKKMPPTKMFVESTKIHLYIIITTIISSLVCWVFSLCMIIPQNSKSVGGKAFEWGSFEKNVQNLFSSKRVAKLHNQESAKITNLPTPSQKMLEIGSYCFGFAIPTLQDQMKPVKTNFKHLLGKSMQICDVCWSLITYCNLAVLFDENRFWMIFSKLPH